MSMAAAAPAGATPAATQSASQAATPAAGASPADTAAIAKVSKQFEAVFLSQFLSSMFEGVKTDGPFGGGQGEAMFRSLELDEYGKQLAARGGFGLSAAIQRELLAAQEKVH